MAPADAPVALAAAAPQTLTVHKREADQQASSLGPLDRRYKQLSRGCFCGSLSSVTHEGVTLFRETLGQSVFQTGCAAGEQITIATACDLSGEAHWNGRHIESDAVVAFVPGREFALRTPVRSMCVGISIPAVRLAASDLDQAADD
jgi:AraC family transcriptional regulator, ethanolamine operon transcriptional activator